jgi:hypothetical protein
MKNAKQPEALRLAEKNADLAQTLRRTSMSLADLIPHLQANADELRRLHEVNVELLDALEVLMLWQVKNVDKWENSAYDYAARVVAKATGETE